jgi:plasmid maintenance system antidote protein VapI
MTKPTTNPLVVIANPQSPIEEFHRRLRAAGTQKRLAESLGLSEQLIGKIVKGQRAISLETAQKLGFELAWRKTG